MVEYIILLLRLLGTDAEYRRPLGPVGTNSPGWE
jgi:hypothetical protein